MSEKDDVGTEAMYKKRAELYKKIASDLHALKTQKSDMLRDLTAEINGKMEQLFELADLPLNQTELPLEDDQE